MRTLKYMKPEKQKEKARETMDIYAPIAQRLGISKVKIELDDLALKYLEPDVDHDLDPRSQRRRVLVRNMYSPSWRKSNSTWTMPRSRQMYREE